MSPFGTLVLSVVFAALVKVTGGPAWVCVIVTGWTFMLLWTDARIGLIVGVVEDMRALLRPRMPVDQRHE